MVQGMSFGGLVRKERTARKIGLREMAKRVGVSATYMSKIERDEMPAPAEDKVCKIADILDQDRDELLALAGRVSTDLKTIIKERPREMAAFLRSAQHWGPEDFERLTSKFETSATGARSK